ncbi:PucR family transcriptional regulator [Neobacillus sp. LXY-4]|uniref:PucR family transcriptional regulator n=1 Tax=Neobacillus sp. LXY-4 TaxID=3379826 RepID=UPI003EE2D1A2
MKITIPMLLERITDIKFSYFPGVVSEEKHISSIRFLKNSQRSINSDVLYITNQTYLISDYKGVIPQKIVCIKDGDFNFDHKLFETSEVILIETFIDTIELADLLQDIFSYYSGIWEELLEIVEESKGLQCLVDKISTIFSNPVRINDWNFKILAMTSFESENVELRRRIDDRTIVNGYIMNSDGFYDDMKNYISKMNENDQPVLFSGSYTCPMISHNLKFQNKKVAMVTVYEVDNLFTNATSDLIVFFSRIITLELQKNEMLLLNDSMKYEYLFTDLLSGKSLSQKEIEKISSYLNYSMSNQYFLVVVSTPVSERNCELTYLKAKILHNVKCNFCIMYERNIVMIFESSSDSTFAQDVLSKLTELLSVRNMFAGISRDFSNLSDIRRKYIEAKKAAELGQRINMKGHIFRYLDLQFYHLIDLCANQEDIKSLCHPALLKLIEEDPELSRTLLLYLKNGKCQTTTAKELHLQRSSLLYRLRKIEEILDIKLKDYHLLLHLQLSFEILNYLNFEMF